MADPDHRHRRPVGKLWSGVGWDTAADVGERAAPTSPQTGISAMLATVMTAAMALIPVWGLVGAAVAAAITNAGTNLWNLLEVRSVLGLSPFSRSYLRLLGPTIVSVLAVVGLKSQAHLLGRVWLGSRAGLIGSYLVFAGMVAVLGLDEDDRLVAQALWSRVRKSVAPAEGLEL